MKDNMFKKIAFNAVVLTAFAAVSAFSASVAKADETATSIDLDTFIRAVVAADYNFDGSKHDSAQGGVLTVKWSPVSGCRDNRADHTCTVENVPATGNTPMRMNSHLAQFYLFNGVSSAVSVKNVAFVYEPTAFTICANSSGGWVGTFTVEQAPAGQLYLLNTGNVTFEDCTFDTAVLTSFNCGETSTVKNCSFKNVYNSYAVKDIRGKTVSVTGCTFENCGAAIMLSATNATVAVKAVTISGNTFNKIDVTDTAPTEDVGSRGLIQIASSGNYSATTFDFSGNEATNCGPVMRQLNKTVTLDTTAKTNLNNLVTDGASLYTEDTIWVWAEIDGTGYGTLEAALAEVAEGKPLTFVTKAAWPVATPVYYNGTFYAKGDSKGALELAIDAANEANSDDVAKIYVRPGFTADELVLQAHQNLKTSLAIYGNDAQLSGGWEPCIEYEGTGYHTLTKDVSISIYNLHKGAGVWGARVTDYTVDVTLVDCQDVHEVLINGSKAPESVNNYTIKNCTFDGQSTAHTGVPVASTSAGKIVIEGCTFANLNSNYVINPNNQNGGAMEVVVKNTSFTNCGTSSKAVIRVAGEKAGTSATVTLDSLTFDEYSAANAIGIGKKELAENNADITYTITNTSGTLSVFEKGGTDETITATTTTLVATEAYAGANFAAVAKIGDTEYRTLADAFAAAEEGQTVKLLADLTETDAKNDAVPYIMTGVTFDLNGYTYTHYNYAHVFQGTGGVIQNGKIICAPYGSNEGAANGSYALFIGYHVNDNGKYEATKTAETTSFTVKNVEMTGGINISHATGVVLENLTVNGTKFYAVWTEEGSSVTIKSGTYTTGAISLLNGEAATTLEVEGGTFTAGDKSLVGTYGVVPSISGGTFDTAVDAKYCAAGFMPAENADGTYGVAGAIQVVAADGTKTTYHSLADAFEAAEEGQTVKLLADVTENATIANDLTLDLNGYTINGGTVKASPTLTVTAKVTIKDSSEAQTGTIKREDTAANSGVTSHYVIDIQGSDASLTFESGTVVNNSGTTEGERAGASLVRVGNDGNVDAMPALTIKGGAFTQNNFTAIKVDYGTFYFQGGTITCENDEAVKNWASAYIQDGTVNGTVASWVYGKSICSSTLEISGGTINGNVYAMTYDGAGDKTATVNITGGTITGGLGIYQGKNIKSRTEFSDANKATIDVTGGKFKNDIKESGYLAEDLTTLYSESESLYVVAPKDSQLVTVNTTTEAGTTETKTVEVALTEDVIKTALTKAGVDTGTTDSTAKINALNKEDANGNPVWVNIVAGIESDKSVAVDAAQNTDAATIDVTPVNIAAAATGMGVQIAYEVDEVTLSTSDGNQTATVEKQGDAVSAAAIDVDSVETSAYFQVKVLVRQNGSTIASVPATNYIGVLKKSTKATKALVPVPWHSLADGGDISVSNVVKTANLTEGDKLSVYVAANKKYNVYTLKDDKTWDPAAVYVIDAKGQVSTTTSGKPDTMSIPRGSGVWLERQDTSTPIVTYGLASATKQTTTIAKATAADDGTVTKAWSLAAVPTTESVALSTLAEPAKATEDKVIVPTEGAPIVYTVKDGAWGYDETVTITDSRGNATGIVTTERKTDATLPAGTGFWYVNGSTDEKSVEW